MQVFDVDFIELMAGQKVVGVWAIAVTVVRNRVLEARAKAGVNFIKLKVNLPDGLEFQYKSSTAPQFTKPGVRAITYTISVNTINPDPNNMLLEGKPIRFNPTSTDTYEVSHFLSIMIAEQIRFSTLKDSVLGPAYAIKNVPLVWTALFKYFFSNFQQQVYNNWKDKGKGPVTGHVNGNEVKVLILAQWRAGP